MSHKDETYKIKQEMSDLKTQNHDISKTIVIPSEN